jgi:hypothetical protein
VADEATVAVSIREGDSQWPTGKFEVSDSQLIGADGATSPMQCGGVLHAAHVSAGGTCECVDTRPPARSHSSPPFRAPSSLPARPETARHHHSAPFAECASAHLAAPHRPPRAAKRHPPAWAPDASPFRLRWCTLTRCEAHGVVGGVTYPGPWAGVRCEAPPPTKATGAARTEAATTAAVFAPAPATATTYAPSAAAAAATAPPTAKFCADAYISGIYVCVRSEWTTLVVS